MNSNLTRRTTRRIFRHTWAAVISLVTILVLAACGTTDPSIATFTAEAHGYAVDGTFDVGFDAEASSGAYLVQPATVPVSTSGAAVVEVAFDLSSGGEHSLWARVRADSLDGDATYLGFNGTTRRVFAPELGRYVWLEVVREKLNKGRHVISLGHGEPGLRIDLFAVTRTGEVDTADLEALVVPPESTTPPTDPSHGGGIARSLRGDPSFDAAALSDEAALWYARMWHDIDHGAFDPIAMAGSDDIYTYGRTLHTYVQSVLVAFRLTGDLALLDHVDEIAERMRAELHDSWRGTLDGTDGTRDGYLNWVDRVEGDPHRGKDTMVVNETKVHAMVAMMAYAFEVNRDLRSPGGRDYAAHADFWKDYLVNHFEAKVRDRLGVPTAFPIMTKDGTHTYYSQIKWHFYMGLLTGSTAYTREAVRMADNVWSDLRTVSTPSGTAYVWASDVHSAGGDSPYLQATNYARYVFGDMVEFHFEGFHNWASASQMERFARAFTEFMIDRADPLRDGFAADIGGEQARAGLKSNDRSRMSMYRYRESSFALFAAWDTSGRIAEINEAVFDAIGFEGAAWLTAASILDATWSDGVFLASR